MFFSNLTAEQRLVFRLHCDLKVGYYLGGRVREYLPQINHRRYVDIFLAHLSGKVVKIYLENIAKPHAKPIIDHSCRVADQRKILCFFSLWLVIAIRSTAFRLG